MHLLQHRNVLAIIGVRLQIADNGMLGKDMAEWIGEAISSYSRETGDGNVYYYDLPAYDGDLVGARFHPSRRAHDEAALALSAELKRILGLTA